MNENKPHDADGPAHDSPCRVMALESPFSTMVFDPAGRLLEVNRAFEEMWGVSAESVAGYELFADKQAHALGMIPLLERAFKGEPLVLPEFSYDVARSVGDGRRRWIRTFVYPLKDDAGRVREVVFMHDDVTVRRQAEEARASHDEAIEGERRRLRQIVATVPGVVWEAWGQPDAAAQRIDFVSDYVEAMLGYTKEEWFATPNFWLTIVHTEDKEQAARNAAEHFAKGGAGVNRFRWVAKDGRVLHVEAHSSVITDAEGQPVGMRGVTLDVTNRRRTEEAARRLADIIEATTDFVALTSAEGQVLYINRAGRRMVGLGEDADLSEFRRGSLSPVWVYERTEREWLPAAMRDGSASGEGALLTRDGRELPVWFVLLVHRNEAGEPEYISSIARDMTERKRAEREREELLEREQGARAEAEAANRLKDEFLATLSHELRTPLTAILGWAQMLGSGTLDTETTRRAVSVIERNAESQRQIVEDVLDASRIVTGKLRIESEEVDLLGVVRESLDAVRPAAAAKDIELICNFDPEVGHIVGDPHRLRQVVWNLLSNAVKFTGQGGCVKVEAGRLLSSVRLTVSDTGEGIAPEFLPFVFDRFRQADGSTTRQHGGLGLGLSIVRHLVEAHGGSVHAYSAGEGQGASFTVELPLPAGARPATRAGADGQSNEAEVDEGNAPANDAPPALFGVRVLLVEDDADTLELMRVFLKSNGAEVFAVSSAEGALEALASARPDIIISDIGMPGADGYELLRRVRALAPEAGGLTPAVAVTAYATDADRVKAARAGFQAHVSKPLETALLLAAIVNLVARASADRRE